MPEIEPNIELESKIFFFHLPAFFYFLSHPTQEGRVLSQRNHQVSRLGKGDVSQQGSHRVPCHSKSIPSHTYFVPRVVNSGHHIDFIAWSYTPPTSTLWAQYKLSPVESVLACGLFEKLERRISLLCEIYF